MTPRLPVILSSSKDWDLWYKLILSLAKDDNVLEFIDDKSPEHISQLARPSPPDIPTELTPEAIMRWKMENAQYDNEMMKYRVKVDGVNRIKHDILETVEPRELEMALIENEPIDVKKLLIALKKRLCPSIAECQYEARLRYENLRKPPKRGLNKWLDEWMLIEHKIRRAGIEGNFDLWQDFFHANRSIDNAYVTFRKKKFEIEGKGNSRFADMVDDFRAEYSRKRLLELGRITSDIPH
ncbi:predicted protein [Histoplasma capsulatum G186AR]|uniref:Uncharacterized protein n=2 Tax=Ajellomyces capsulatus TaxID=5037 RepID=C0NTJ5_AJECG|nr:uncharacterized protein HCBG_06475 [Histoplasma capsulatum G186AR]EEH05356.1 predicted protein [Histoplasma capsulatum G186AR]KAG5305272.1 hypothetical protein I7I52_03876 [Histoplasma capsulatum]QSS76233.1 hypothetical protein I7I50_05616 [Histoplasma capsulatum G186AR]